MSAQPQQEDILVNITTLKQRRERAWDDQSQGEESNDDEEDFPEDYTSLNAYKDWYPVKGHIGINLLFVLH